MNRLIKIEFFKLFSGKKVLYFYGVWVCLISLLICFLRIFASGSSFGNIFKTSSDTFSIFAVLVGVIMVLVSFNQEIQQKTIKSLLVTPVRRNDVLFSKLFVSISASCLMLIMLCLTAFLATGLLFGFFTEGTYSSSSENMLAFTAGIIQIVTAFFTTIFFSSTILCLFLLTNSLSISLIGAVLLRGIGELASRSLLNQNNLVLYYSPLGVSNILNPLTTNGSLPEYTIQLILTLVYSVTIFYISCKLFENKEL